MNENQNQATFQYTYSAREQEEVKKIRSKYIPREESKMELLRRMDVQVTQKAHLYAIIVGVVGAMIFGVGMCCCLVWAETMFFWGIIVGLLGMAVLGLAYPIYRRTLKKEREKVASEVLCLTEDLMQ